MKPKHRIVMLNVGQGDAFVVQLASGEVIVVDCNQPCSRTTPPTISILEQIAHNRGNANIDVLCLTHPHLDHFSGMREVFTWCKRNGGTIGKLVVYVGMDRESVDRLLREVAILPIEHGSDVLEEFILLKKEIAEFEKNSPPHRFVLGVGAQRLIDGTGPDGHYYCVDVMGPLGSAVQNNVENSLRHAIRQMHKGMTADDGDANDMSCLLAIRCNGCTTLFTGDSSARMIADAWDGYVETYGCKDCVGIVKMPHHGSRGEKNDWENSKGIWQRILRRGTLALLSYGSGNRYRHPNQALLETLQAGGVLTVSTNACGGCPSGGIATPDSLFCDDEEEPLSDGLSIEAVEVTIDDVGAIAPAAFDAGRRCDLCNSLAVHAMGAVV